MGNHEKEYDEEEQDEYDELAEKSANEEGKKNDENEIDSQKEKEYEEENGDLNVLWEEWISGISLLNGWWLPTYNDACSTVTILSYCKINMKLMYATFLVFWMQRKLQAIPQFTNDDLIPIYSKLILKISQPAHDGRGILMYIIVSLIFILVLKILFHVYDTLLIPFY